MRTLRLFTLLTAFVLLATPFAAVAQDQVPRGSAREAMWPAPTAEDWEKPCLITFQRSWEDAVAVAREENKAILLCINMDGEIASEHYAGKRYRNPETTQLYEPYVCVIASVYRHTPRDYDDAGKRVLCPRFGSVTCGEHITIEPILYEKFLDGQRIAPRHIMVELDGDKFAETYDVFYANDTASVFEAIRVGIAERTEEPKTIVRGDRPVLERVGSRHIADRKAVEQAYKDGDQEMRKKLLEAARQNTDSAPIELLRLAVFGFDKELSAMARKALAETKSVAATDVIVEALDVPMTDEDREALIAALERLGETSRKAQWMASVQRGLSGGKTELDVAGWSAARGEGSGTYEAPSDWFVMEAEHWRAAAVAKARPDSPEAHVDVAVAALALAFEAPKTFSEDRKTARTFERHMFEAARSSAATAAELGSEDWRVSATLGLAAYYDEKDNAKSYDHAATAVLQLPPGDTSWNSVAILTIYAESRFNAIKTAVKNKERWPPQALTDLHAAYSVLLHHPLATDTQMAWHYDFLDWLRARRRAGNFLTDALDRFPNSSQLHKRFRDRMLKWRGVERLEEAYEEKLAAEDPAEDLHWFAGYASIVAAEQLRKSLKEQESMEAYSRAIAHYENAIVTNPDSQGSADHYISLAHAGRARLAYQLGDDVTSLVEILASFKRNPLSAGTRDGVGITPGETGQMLMARLLETEQTDAAAQLGATMSQLDPELLRPDRP